MLGKSCETVDLDHDRVPDLFRGQRQDDVGLSALAVIDESLTKTGMKPSVLVDHHAVVAGAIAQQQPFMTGDESNVHVRQRIPGTVTWGRDVERPGVPRAQTAQTGLAQLILPTAKNDLGGELVEALPSPGPTPRKVRDTHPVGAPPITIHMGPSQPETCTPEHLWHLTEAYARTQPTSLT